MKKKYIIPQMQTVLLCGPVVMLGGSNTVHDFNDGGDIYIGDSDEPSDEP